MSRYNMGRIEDYESQYYRHGSKSKETRMEESLSAIVQRHRKKSGLSRERLAEIAGVGKTVIYDIEHGKASVRYSTVKKVLDALNIRIRYISPLEEDSNEKG